MVSIGPGSFGSCTWASSSRVIRRSPADVSPHLAVYCNVICSNHDFGAKLLKPVRWMSNFLSPSLIYHSLVVFPLGLIRSIEIADLPGEGRKHEEQQRVGRQLQVKIEKTVD